MLLHAASQNLKVAAFTVRAEICPHTLQCCGVYQDEVWHCASLQVARRLDHIRMLEVPVTPGKLVDEVQAMELVENFNKAVEAPSPSPTGLIVTPFPLPPRNDPAFVLAALDLCHVLADRLCIPISSFEASDSAGRLPLHYAAATEGILDIYGKLGADRLKRLITKASLEKSDGTPAGHPAWQATHPQLASQVH